MRTPRLHVSRSHNTRILSTHVVEVMHEAAATARCWPHLNVTQLSGDANSIFARLGGQVGIYTYTMYWLVATALVVGWWVGTSGGAICENSSIKSVRTFLRSSPTHAINRSNVSTKLPYGRFISSSSLSLFFLSPLSAPISATDGTPLV